MFMNKMLKVLIFYLILAVSVGSAGNEYYNIFDPRKVQNDERIKQNYKDSTNTMLVAQVRKELQASYLYRAYASFYQRADVNLPGIQKFFLKASDEEKGHAQLLIDYINKRGGHATFNDINLLGACSAIMTFNKDNYPQTTPGSVMCICGFVSTKEINDDCIDRADWKNGLYGFEDALATERYVNSELLKIHQHADSDKVGDAHLAHLLEHDFLEEQVDSINELGHYVTRLKSFKGDSYSLGEYMFDQKLG